jgi:hypothetical protein
LVLKNAGGSTAEGMSYVTVSTKVGAKYLVEVEFASGSAVVQVGWNGGGNNNYQSAESGNRLSEFFTATKPVTMLTIRRYSGSGETRVSKASMKEVVAPAALDPILGPEMVANGSFEDGNTGWSRGAGWTISDGVATHSGPSGALNNPSVVFVPGKTYLVSVDVVSGASGEFYIGSLGGNHKFSPVTSSSTYFIARPTDSGVLYLGLTTFEGSVTNISVREIYGNHAIQDAESKKPIYGVVPKVGRRNLLSTSEYIHKSSLWDKRDGVAYTGNTYTFPVFSSHISTIFQTAVQVPTAGKTFTFSAVLSGSGKVRLKNTHAGIIDNFGPEITLTSTPTLHQYMVINANQAGTSQQLVALIPGPSNAGGQVTVHSIQFEEGAAATPHQRVYSYYHITEDSVPSVGRLFFDSVDDFMVVQVPDGLSYGTVHLASSEGTGSYEDADLSTGVFNIGPYFPGTDFRGMAMTFGLRTSFQEQKTAGKFMADGAGVDYASADDVSRFWRGMSYMTTFPNFDLSGITHAAFSWYGCTALTTFAGDVLAGSYAKNFTGAFVGTNLSQDSLDGILSILDSNGVSGGTFDQSGGAAPSVVGREAIENLRSRGWATTHAAHTPSDLFFSDDTGVQFDPSTLGSLWQTTSMQIPCLPGDPVGLMLDQSEWAGDSGELLGPNLAVVSEVSGPPIGGNAFNNLRISGGLEKGVVYQISFTVNDFEGTDSVGIAGGSIEGIQRYTSNGSVIFYAKGLGSSGLLLFTRDTNYARFSDITIREVVSRFGRKVLGKELAVNGGFDSASNWDHPHGPIQGGKAEVTNGLTFLSQDMGLTSGKTYRVSYDYTFSSGVRIRVNTGIYPGSLEQMPTVVSGTSSGTVEGEIVAETSMFRLEAAGSQFTGTIDNVSVREVFEISGMSNAFGEELVSNGDFSDGSTGWQVGTNDGTGWSIANGVATLVGDGSVQTLIQPSMFDVGSYYYVSFDVTASAAEIGLEGGSGVVILKGSSGHVGGMIKAEVSALTFKRTGGVVNGTIANVSVRKVLGRPAIQDTAAQRPIYGVRPQASYGENIVKNGGFHGDASDWGVPPIGSSGYAELVNGAARLHGNCVWSQALTTVIGETYELYGEVLGSSNQSGATDLRIGTGPAGYDVFQGPNVGPGKYTYTFVATSVVSYVSIKTHHTPGDLSKFSDFTNIRVRRVIPGNRNLVVGSDSLTNLWGSVGMVKEFPTVSGPFGTNVTGVRMIPINNSEHYTEQSLSVNAPGVYSQSIYVKADSIPAFHMMVVHVGSPGVTSTATFHVNLNTGEVSTGSRTNIISSSAVEDAGGGWYRCSVIYTLPSGVSGHRMRLYSGLSGPYQGNSETGLLAWGAQTASGSVVSPYQSTITKFSAKEEHKRRNLARSTNDLTSSEWLKNNGGISVVPSTGPAGEPDAFRINFTGPNQQLRSLFSLPTGTYTGSAWIKGTKGETIRVRLNGYAEVNIVLTGEFQKVVHTGVGAPSVINFNTYSGVTARSIVVWHPQIEEGSTATDYQEIVGEGFELVTVPSAHYIEFDGVDDAMATHVVDFSGTSQLVVFAELEYYQSGRAILLELSTSYGNPGTFALQAPSFGSRLGLALGSTQNGSNASITFDVPGTGLGKMSAVVAQFDSAAASITGEESRGTQYTTIGNSFVSRNFIASNLFIGGRAGNGEYMHGKVFGITVLGRGVDAESVKTVALNRRIESGRS